MTNDKSGVGEDYQRVLADLTHGGHALDDTAEDAMKTIDIFQSVKALSAVAQVSPAEVDEVATTTFNYLFTDLVTDEASLLPHDNPATVVTALTALGQAMVEPDPAPGDLVPTANSSIPPIYTYWGQFIDHDMTANTDRDGSISITVDPLEPLDPAFVITHLQNLRNPALNLDSVYGNGPFAPQDPAAGEFVPYDGIKLRVGRAIVPAPGVPVPPAHDLNRDLPRRAGEADPTLNGRALIGDGRNDENLIVAQLHVAFLRFHNAAVDWVRVNEPERVSDAEIFLRARDLTRWTYQWLVVHDFLRTITVDGVVDRVLTDDDNLLQLHRRGTYMPLEYSVAAFRFGHSMVRPVYDWNRNFGRPGNSTAPLATFVNLFEFTGKANPKFKFGLPALPANWIAEWDRLVDKNSLLSDRFARRIDTKIAFPLSTLLNEGTDPNQPQQIHDMLKQLAVRNLLRGYRLSLPTGQAVAGALGITPLSPADLQQGSSQAVTDALTAGGLLDRTPLWFYLLKEAEIRTGGNSLGAVGSELVAQTIIAQLRQDAGSYLHRSGWNPAQGVQLTGGAPVRSIPDFLRFAGVLS